MNSTVFYEYPYHQEQGSIYKCKNSFIGVDYKNPRGHIKKFLIAIVSAINWCTLYDTDMLMYIDEPIAQIFN